MAESFHKYRRREAHRAIRQRDRARLGELRTKIRGLRARRRSALSEIRAHCRAERHRVSAEARELRQATRERLKLAIAEMRAAQRGTCSTTKSRAKERLSGELATAADELRRERERQQGEREADREKRKRDRPRATAGERRTESDDRVRQELSPELVTVFDKVKGKIRATERKSRAEAFLHWAEENPGEVLDIQAAAGERAFLKELRELEAEHKRLAKTHRRRRHSETELAAALAGVPF